MSTLKKLDELTDMVILLQNNNVGLTIDELSEKLECKRRTTERMLEVLKEKCGEKLSYIYIPTDRKKHWKLQKSPMNFGVNISNFEISKLKILSNKLKNQSDRQIINNLIEKIKIINPAKNYNTDIDMLLKMQGLAVRQQVQENINPNILSDIEFCLLCQLKLKIKYKDSCGCEGNYIVEPYGIKIADNQYLIAKESGILKTYKISRIISSESQKDYFTKDDDFDIQKYCELSFGIYTGNTMTVVLKFSKEVESDAKNYYFHPTQKSEYDSDGNYVITFTASGSYEIITEVLKWRGEVEILSPKSLRQEYDSTVRKMYEKIL